jgi:hypothetical protein
MPTSVIEAMEEMAERDKHVWGLEFTDCDGNPYVDADQPPGGDKDDTTISLMMITREWMEATTPKRKVNKHSTTHTRKNMTSRQD